MPEQNPCKKSEAPRFPDEATGAGPPRFPGDLLLAPCCEPPLLVPAPPLEASQAPGVIHLAAPPRPCLLLVELTEDFQIRQTSGVDDDAASAAAQPVHYRRTGNEYFADGDVGTVLVYDVLARRDGSGDPLGPPLLRQGDRAWAYANAHSGRWELTCYPGPVRRFQLSANLAPGASASAAMVAWTGTTWATTGTTFTVYDSLGCLEGLSGAPGVAIYWADSNRWEVVAVCPPTFGEPLVCCDVLSDVAMSGTDLVFTRKQFCAPPGSTVTALSDLVISGCCSEGSGSP
jgi:hypothetical protein